MTTVKTQALVIGAGPGGYVAAFHLADLGMEVTQVDMEKVPGGVCLLRGCIPTKALLHASSMVSQIREAKAFGIECPQTNIDFKKLNAWKNDVVAKLTDGLGQLRLKRGVRFIQGKASFMDSGNVRVTAPDGSLQQISFDYAVIATGSYPVRLPLAPDSPLVLDSTSALDIETIPESLLVVGGGYIGLEFATLYSDLGCKVSLVEMTSGLLPGMDRDLVDIVGKRLSKSLVSIRFNAQVTKIQETQNGLTVTTKDKDGKILTEEYKKVLMAVGRKPLTQELALEKTKVSLDQNGFIKVNGQRQTADPKIYAVGDVAGQPMLAHKAYQEAHVAAQAITGKKAVFEPRAIPSVVYTDPEIVSCGLTEEDCRQQNRAVTIAKFPWAASGRAITLNRTDGLTKILVDPQTQRILGMGIVGINAGELVSEAVLAVEMGAVVDDLRFTIHPHPTLSETLKEAADMTAGMSVHIFKPKSKAL